MRTLPPIRFLNACGDTFHRITRRPLFHVKSRKVKQQLKELREVVPEEVADEIETSIDLLDEAYSEEKGFSPAQRLLTSIFLSNLGLKPRVALEKAYLEHQEVLQKATLPRTLLVTGMARTGSTLLHNLLGQDPSCRYLTGWEQQHPLPFPTADTYHSDPRIEKAREGFKGMDKLVSNATRYYRMYHDHDGAALEEEYYLLLHSVLFPSIILPRTGSHFDFFLKEDKFAAYQHLKNFLLLNCHYHPPKSHLVLKTPLHGFHMKELLATFNKDEAVLVVTHRNPKNTVPSLCRLMLFTMVIGMREVGKDPMYCVEEVGKRTAEWQHIITERVREATTHITPKTGHKVVHVEYRDLIRDPIGTVRGIYEAAGLSFTPEYEDALRAYLEASARERESGKGSHHMPYSLEEFGLSDEYIENMFAQYMKEHGYR
eukprot:TRINITY_DN9088_c0_g1_i1.p1 TRINITY_DN9088_c0_g1~~TRINITY_DN9088_c0_g1_i1.p1  ORF type:complete len:473 (-),score=167.12 TRINITY_DN9088_c0_g1_i1:244-1530(-)